jgi:two-component system alkaline phosphatase synthesis response regulator PhoP
MLKKLHKLEEAGIFTKEEYEGNVRIMAKTLLVVDDNERLRTLVKAYLAQEGYRVVTAGDGREALFVARQEKPDLIILDIMMPEMDGYEFIRVHRKEKETPIIMLTAKLEESDTVLGLELGADDYITKPFSMRVLAARVKAVLRRTGQNAPEPEILRAADITLDRGGRSVMVGDRFVDLTPTEFDLLATFMAAPGRVFARLDLIDQAQGIAYEGYERSIDTHIANLRAKIEPNPRTPRYIETIYGVGYRFTTSG